MLFIYCSESRAEGINELVCSFLLGRQQRWQAWAAGKMNLWHLLGVCVEFGGFLGLFCFFSPQCSALNNLRFSWCQNQLFFLFHDLHYRLISRNCWIDVCDIYREGQYTALFGHTLSIGSMNWSVSCGQCSYLWVHTELNTLCGHCCHGYQPFHRSHHSLMWCF